MDIQSIKKEFFARRNGVTADVLRKAGMPYKVIFGLQVPQLAEIARGIGYDDSLAETLWSDSDVRESRLLATYLFNPANMSIDKAIGLSRKLQTREEADMLAFRLLRYLSCRDELHTLLVEDKSHPFPYVAEALARFL